MAALMDSVPRRVAYRLCNARDVPTDAGLRVQLPGRDALAVFRVGDEFFVTDDLCTHGGASLAEGTLCDDEIECPFHLGRFSLRTGEVTRSPCIDPLTVYPCQVRAEEVYVLLTDEG